jgi:hypothetical protein
MSDFLLQKVLISSSSEYTTQLPHHLERTPCIWNPSRLGFRAGGKQVLSRLLHLSLKKDGRSSKILIPCLVLYRASFSTDMFQHFRVVV